MKQFEALTRKDSQPVRYLIVDDSVFARKSLAFRNILRRAS